MDNSRPPVVMEMQASKSPTPPSPVSINLSKPKGSYSIDSILGNRTASSTQPSLPLHHSSPRAYSINDSGNHPSHSIVDEILECHN